MTVVQLSGIVPGSTFAMGVSADGGSTTSKTVTDYHGTTRPVLIIQPNRFSGTHPAGFVAKAIASGFGVDNHVTDLDFKWTYGKPGATFSHMAADMFWNDANTSFGAVGGTVLEHSGAYGGFTEYLVTCTATDPLTGDTASANMTFRVNDAEAFFAGRTACIGSTLTGAPAGALGPYATMGLAMAALPSGKARFLRQRGTDLTNNNSFTGYTDLCIGAYGTGARPINRGSITDLDTTGQIMILDQDMDGGYDAAASNPQAGWVAPSDGIVSNGPAFRTILRSRLVGYYTPLNLDRSNINVCDVEVGSWFNYGFLGSDGNGPDGVGLTGGWQSWHGFTAKQPTGTKNSNPSHSKWQPKSGYYYPNHGPWRLTRVSGPVMMDTLDMTSFNDWASDGAQPFIRWNSGGDAIAQWFNITRLRGEGSAMSIVPGNSDAIARPNNVRLDMTYILVPWSNPELFDVPYAGMRATNIITILGRMPAQSVGVRGVIRYANKLALDSLTPDPEGVPPYAQTAANAAGPFTTTNITIIDQRITSDITHDFDLINRTDGSNPVLSGAGTITDYLVHAPDWVGAPTPLPSLDLTGGRWTTTFDGWHYNQLAVSSAYASTPAMAVMPYPTAAGTVTRKTTYDFLGRARPATNDTPGALMPA